VKARGPERGQTAGGDFKRRTLRVVFWSLAATLLFNSLLGDMGLVQGIRQRRAAARLRTEVAALRVQNTALTSDIRELREEPYRIETIAREELGLSRPGEIIFLFKQDGLPTTEEDDGVPQPTPPRAEPRTTRVAP
jgi:cell division protein FtsB